jgi:hypothetical protein
MTTEDQYTLAKIHPEWSSHWPLTNAKVFSMDVWNGTSGTSGPKGGFLCDEMGLGKTVQLLATMLANPQPRTFTRRAKIYHHTMARGNCGKFCTRVSLCVYYDGPEQ